MIASTGIDSGIGAVNPLLYRGYYYNLELGMYYLRSRYYDPGVKRFINADSVDYLGPGRLSGYGVRVSADLFPGAAVFVYV